MRRLLSILLSFLMVMTTIIVIPPNVSAADSEDYPNCGISVRDEFAAWGLNEDGEGASIYDGRTAGSHKGISYNKATNTLTLDNVPWQNNAFILLIDNMGDLNVNLVGESGICTIQATDTNLNFVGNGKLNLNPPMTYTMGKGTEWEETYENEHIFGMPLNITNGTVKIAHTVTITLDGYEKDETSVTLTYNEPKKLDEIFQYNAVPTEELKWNYEEIDNSYYSNEYISNVRFRTKFPANRLMYLEGDNSAGNYWIVSNRTGSARNSYQISRLVEIDGEWFETNPSNNDAYFWYQDWNGDKYYHYNDIIHPDGYYMNADESKAVDVKFVPYEDASNLPETLVKDGYVTANIFSATDNSGKTIYEKNGEKFILNLEIASSYWAKDMDGNTINGFSNGINNYMINAIEPAAPQQKGYAYSIYKVRTVNNFSVLEFVEDIGLHAEEFTASQNGNGKWVANGEEYDSRYEAESALYSAFNKSAFDYFAENGYEQVRQFHEMPMSYIYRLNTSKFTFNPGEAPTEPSAKINIDTTTVRGIKNKVYTGKSITQSITVKNGTTTLKSGTDYSVAYKNNKNVGTATMTIQGIGNYTGTITKTFKITKAANPMKITNKTTTVKYAKVKKAKQTVAPLTVSKAQGAVSYKKTSGSAKLTVNSKGKVTVKKKTKKGTYKIKVKVTAKGNANYKSLSKTVTVKVKVK